MGMFNKDLKIGDGQKYDLTQVSQDGVDLEEVAKKNKKLIDIFKAFDLDGNNKLDDLELAKAMDAFSRLDNGDGKLSKKELEAGAVMFNEMTNLNIEGKDLKAFLKKIAKAAKNDGKVGTQARLELESSLEKMKQVQVPVEKPVLNVPQPKDEPIIKELPPVMFSYTVQNGENYNNLIKRILKAKGIKNPTKEDIANAKAEFEKHNPGAVKKTPKGTEYLLVGARIKIGADLGDKNNAAEQVGKYADEASEKAKYNVDAFYRNKDGSEGRRLKLKPTGEKAENGRFWAVDEKGNRYLVAQDGTILDAAKVAKKDAAAAKAKERAALAEAMISNFNALKADFEVKVANDGVFANTADAIAGFFGSTNTEDHVRADLQKYEDKLNELKAAAKSGDTAKFDKLYKELSQNDITARVAKYHQSQETGGKVVKGVTVGVVTGIAAVATGGTSLLATAAVAGGTTFVASTAAETIDLATNDIDGDVNSDNMKRILKQAGTEAAFSAVTAGLLKGAGNLLAKGGSSTAGTAGSFADDAANAGKNLLPAASNSADDAVNAGRSMLPRTAANAASNSADDAANAGAKALPKPKPKTGSSSGASSGADDAANAGTRTGSSGTRTGSTQRTNPNPESGTKPGSTSSSRRGPNFNDTRHTRDLGLDDIANLEEALNNGTLSKLDISRLVDITGVSRSQLEKMSSSELNKLLQSKGGLKNMFTKYKGSFATDTPIGLNWAKQNPQAFQAITDKVTKKGIASLNDVELKQLSDLLEMPVDALKKLSKANYKKLSVRFHPDKHANDETAKQIFQMLTRMYSG